MVVDAATYATKHPEIVPVDVLFVELLVTPATGVPGIVLTTDVSKSV
jgi:hypothetical protein